MADLYRIFSEEGLAGLLPYALKDTSHGYRILVDKIKAGYPLTFIRTKMEVPYLVVKRNIPGVVLYNGGQGPCAGCRTDGGGVQACGGGSAGRQSP